MNTIFKVIRLSGTSPKPYFLIYFIYSELFNLLRDIIEDKNILVFQISMPVEDARGFAIADETPAIIVVNSKDHIEARVFSLMHEFGHILLKESGISLPENTLIIKSPNR